MFKSLLSPKVASWIHAIEKHEPLKKHCCKWGPGIETIGCNSLPEKVSADEERNEYDMHSLEKLTYLANTIAKQVFVN